MHGRAKKTLKRCIGARALARARATQRADRDRLLKGVLGSELELTSCKATNLPPSVFWPEGVRKHKITTAKVSKIRLLRRKKIVKWQQVVSAIKCFHESFLKLSSSEQVKTVKSNESTIYWRDENLYLPKWLCNLKKMLMPINKNCFRKIVLN